MLFIDNVCIYKKIKVNLAYNLALMKKSCLLLLFLVSSPQLFAQTKDAHVPTRLNSAEVLKMANHTTEDTLATAFGNKVYYVHNELSKQGFVNGSIFCYTNDKVQEIRLSDNFANKDEEIPVGKIVQMLVNPSANKLYYTVLSKEIKGVGVYMTMEYDLITRHCRAYRDGILESIDSEGKQTVYYHGIDNIGAYKSKNVFDADGRLLKSFDKEYVSTISR